MNRACATLLASVLVLGAIGAPATVLAGAGDGRLPTAAQSAASSGDEPDDDTGDDTTRPTINEFFPEERPLGDCLSSLPKPDCGSEARGGGAQTAVFVLIVAGLAFIAWRIVAGSRRARREHDAVTQETPGATTVRDESGGGPAP